jgi:hypothetical protein
LRPTIVNTADQAADITRRQYDLVRGADGLDPIVARQLQEEMTRRNQTIGAPPPVAAQASAPQAEAP